MFERSSLFLILLLALISTACSDNASRSEPSGQLETSLPAAALVATPDPTADAEEQPGAFGGTLDGRRIYERACASCHDDGFNGAPRLVARDWPGYEQIGVEPYTIMAIQGVGIMPPRGGRPDLTDAQVRAAMQFILDRL